MLPPSSLSLFSPRKRPFKFLTLSVVDPPNHTPAKTAARASPAPRTSSATTQRCTTPYSRTVLCRTARARTRMGSRGAIISWSICARIIIWMCPRDGRRRGLGLSNSLSLTLSLGLFNICLFFFFSLFDLVCRAVLYHFFFLVWLVGWI